MNKEKVINEIKYFLEGKNNDLKYLVNVEASPESNKAKCVIHEPGKDHRIEEISFQPFLYTKDIKKSGYALFNGNKDFSIAQMKKHGITIKKLKTGNHPRLEDGYLYKVTSSKSYNHILQFFKDGGVDPFESIRDEHGKIVRDKNDRAVYKYRDLFYMPKINEQFFISTGARLFKGIEEYKDLHRLTFDIETTSLRYQHGRIFAIGVRDNRGLEIVLEVEKDNDDDAERDLIIKFFNLIYLIKPATISGYHSEEFDFNFIIGRAEILGIDLAKNINSVEKNKKKLITSLSENHNIRKVSSTVKFGGSTERYRATIMWGYTILDILHAVKRTVAVNSDIKNNKLKYICQFEGIAKPNRMYIEGDKIGKLWNENKVFIINKNNNQYIEIPLEYQELANDLLSLQNNKKNIDEKKYNFLKKSILEKDENLVEWLRENTKKLFDDSLSIQENFRFIRGKKILRRYLLDDLWETEQVDNLYNQSSFLLAKIVPTTYQRIATMGNAAVWNLLMTAWSYENDLAIPHPDKMERFSGGLARCYKRGYTKRLVKIDYASLYPMIQLTEDVFPFFDITGVIKKMLMYMTTTRNIYKKLAAEKKLTDEEVSLLEKTDHDTYEKYINNSFTKEERNLFKVKQLPIKILNNSLFGALGSGFAFNWSDNICAARITCTGRLHLRHAIDWFRQFGCEPLLAVTDGVNFSIPDKTNIIVGDSTDYPIGYVSVPIQIEEAWQYNGQVGISALIEKFNKEEMKPPFMSVDDDGQFDSCLNLSRINYALMSDKIDKKTGKPKTFINENGQEEKVKKIKFTGNTIKSKTMPEYIEEFIDNGMQLILKGKGYEFVDYYHDYAEKIFYKQIPLKKIASKSKYKISIKEYLNRGTDKNGKMKARQAHMELVIAKREKVAREIFEERFDEFKLLNPNKTIEEYSIEEIKKITETYMPLEPEIDSMLYYVNNGTRKSHGDVKTVKSVDEDGKEIEEVQIRATLIDSKNLEKNPNMTGDYNVDKYLDAFNTRVEVLLDGFDEEIRNKILVKIKRQKVADESGKKIEQVELEKNLFTRDELQLKSFEHDNIEESMFLEDKEVEFWNRTGYDPKLIWNDFKTNQDDLLPEIYQHALDFLSEKMVKNGKSKIKSVNEELNKNDYILIKNFDNYNLGYFNGEFVEIVRKDIEIPKSPKELELQNKLIEEENNLKKLEVEDDKVINDEIKQKIDNEEKLKNYYSEFLDKNNIKYEGTMQSLFEQIPNAKLAFDDFVKEKDSSGQQHLEYYNFDEGDY